MLEREQGHELVVLDLTAVVCVDLCDEPLDVYCHFKLVLDDVDQAPGVDVAASISVSAKCHIRIQGVFLVRLVLEVPLFSYDALELFE